MKPILSLSCLLIAFLLNPLWGCGTTGEREFEFGERDMATYAEGRWSGHMAYPSGEETDFELVIEQGTHDTRQQGLEDEEYRTIRQPSCNDNIRHFVPAAQACGGMNKSVLPITARLTTDDGRYDGAVVNGELVVWGYELTNGDFRLELDDTLHLFTECDEQKRCNEGAFETNAEGELDEGFVTMEKM